MSQTQITIAVALFALSLPAASLAAEGTAIQITSGDGETVSGRLMEWDPQGVALEVGNEKVWTSADDLLRFDVLDNHQGTTSAYKHIRLVDESTLPISSLTVKDRVVNAKLSSGGEILEIPTDKVQVLELAEGSDASRQYIKGLVERELPDDLLVVQKGTPPQFDFLQGVVGDVSDNAVSFNWDGDTINVKRSKLAAIVYYQSETGESQPVKCWLTTRSGARLNLKSWQYNADSANGAMKMVLHGGVEFSMAIGELVSADLSGGKLVYLSDVKPVKQTWKPLVGFSESVAIVGHYGMPRNNQSFSGSPLSLEWPQGDSAAVGEVRQYARGLAVRSRTVLEYRIPTEMKRFRTIVGIDPLTADQGHVRLDISAGKSKLWEGEIDGKAAPQEIDVELPLAKRLRIVVDYGQNLDYGDRLHLIEARMTR